ncbi:phage polarity suppression protein [Klebsiella quasipneumoniae]|uniref:phage polarity suppression protein n=1 Tax=Klebsiella quasipneumoniae TaxID=1463165 RepID=UPI002076847A|nr:phage polarity suppression protein [Klebsiella quasipneumoniae]MCM8548596.1 phage polarity suppression protein [Klebsiella quasipneumoniae]HDE1064424.1 phage polarity suppression protein [Klebsiella quasipneumoniae]
MTVATTPAQALDQFRAARSRWQAHLTARQDAETALSALLLAGKKQADYSERVPALRERIAVLDWQINCAAREGVYAQRIVLEACTEDALSAFMREHGPALISALAPFLNGPGGLEVAARLLRSAVAREVQRARPAVAAAYKDALAETGLCPEGGMLRDCEGSYTPAQHQRFTQRLSRLPQEDA